MEKNKKTIIYIITVIVIVILLILLYNMYSNNKYSLGNITKMLNSKLNLSNIHITYEESNANSTHSTTTTDILIKDNFYYINTKDVETSKILTEYYYDVKDSKLIIVNNEDLTVIELKGIESKNFINNFLGKESFISLCGNCEYEYIGKEEINKNQCLKICLTEKNDDQINKIYFYIDEKDNNIMKMEGYKGSNSRELERTFERTYTYSYNEVTDNDNLTFDTNKYKDYSFTSTTV